MPSSIRSFEPGDRRTSIRHSETMTLLGQRVSVDFEIAQDELSRRTTVGLGSLEDRELLAVLFELPCDLPVTRAVLTPRTTRLLRGAPTGVVELTRSHVVRRVTPAVRLTHVWRQVARSSLTVTRLRTFSSFAPFAQRSVLAAPFQIDSAAYTEAARLGIGLRTHDGSLLLEPAPFVVRRHTHTSWLFAEQALGALMLQDASLGSKPRG